MSAPRRKRGPWVAMRQSLAQWIAPASAAAPQRPPATQPRPQGAVGRAYSGAAASASSAGFGGSQTSADTELAASLSTLRSRSRQMVRDAAYAKRARNLVVNNVIGTGMGLQCQVMTTRGQLHEPINAAIEAEWDAWCDADSCHTGGALAFGDMERAAMAQVFDAGEAFLRVHLQPFGRSRVPLGLELVEAERLAHELVDPSPTIARGELRLGVEVDGYQRALAYWIRHRHPGDLRHGNTGTDLAERVPASMVFHLRVIDRWPQSRGEPWMHNVLRKLDDMNEFTGLEVQAARGSASYFATVESADDAPLGNDGDDDDHPAVDIDPLTIQHLDPGKKLVFHNPNRPNSALDPFMRYMLREVAAGTGPSYESLSRDYSQSNYSSSRLALLDDRDLWRVLQSWWIRNFRMPLHRLWLQQAALAKAVPGLSLAQYAADPRKWEACRFKPRGWTWVDPTKEVNAYKEAIRGGLTTLTDVVAATAGGQDIEDLIKTRKRERQLLAEAGIEVDTEVQAPAPVAPPPMPAPPAPPSPDDDGEDQDQPAQAKAARVLHMPARP